MTAMTGSESILNKGPEELGRFLLEAARQDSAPRAARERALLSVSSVALSVGVASTAAAYGSPTSLAKASGWLVAKWLLTGLGSGVLTLAVAQGVQQLATGRTQPAPSVLANAPRRPGVAAKRRFPSQSPQADTPTPPAEAVPSLTASAPVASFAGAAASAPRVAALAAPSLAEPSVSASSSVLAEPSTLTRELALLEQARSSLAQHSAPRALQALSDYRAQFPSGSLQAEAAALRVEAVGQAGDRASAQRLAAAFLTSYPTSPLAARVRSLSNSFRSDAPK